MASTAEQGPEAEGQAAREPGREQRALQEPAGEPMPPVSGEPGPSAAAGPAPSMAAGSRMAPEEKPAPAMAAGAGLAAADDSGVSMSGPAGTRPRTPGLRPREAIPGLRRLKLTGHAARGGRAFAMLTVLPTVAVVAWLLPGLPLLLAGRFLPVPMVLISAPVAVALTMLAARDLPSHWPTPGGRRRADGPAGADWAAWWGLAGTALVAAAFAVWQFLMNSPHLIVDRDPGAYLQFGYWIAEHGSLPIPPLPGAFGGATAGISFSSFGFASHGGAVVPGYMAGLPITLAAGSWTHGLSGAAAMSPLLGAFALLAVGGLTGRLAGPAWAPVGALLLAVSLPEIYTSRSAFTGPLAQVLVFGGLCLVVDSLAPRQSRVLAALGGLALGLAVLVGVGALMPLLPAIVFAGALLAVRRPQAIPFSAGLGAGVGYGLIGGYVLAGPTMSALASQLRVSGLAAAGFAAVTAAGAAAALVGPVRGRLVKALAARPLRWLPEAGAVVVVAVAAGFLVRPYVQKVHGSANNYVAALQQLAHLPVDARRLYAENSLYWVIWYLGAPALVLSVAGLALLARRGLRALLTWRDPDGAARAWALPLMVIGWGAVTVLWLPGGVPDQPWASRRLVPVLLPGLVVCAVWTASWLTARAREHGAGLTAISAAVACFAAALAAPAALITLGVGARRVGPPGTRPSATGIAFQRTGAGELGAIGRLCGAIPGNSSVLILDRVAAREFTQVIRGMCGAPAAIVADSSPAGVEVAVTGVERAGRRPLLLATRPEELTRFQTRPRRVMDLATTQDAHLLTQPPASTWPARYVVWVSAPGGSAAPVSGA